MKRKYPRANAYRTTVMALLTTCSLLLGAATALSAVGTSVPVSAALATSIAADLFPVTVKLDRGNLFLTEPAALFLEHERVGIQVRVQAYDHRPAQGIAISEMGRATLSGTLGYDAAAQQVLLADPRIDKLEFDQNNEATRNFLGQIDSAWSTHVTNPLRARIPPHPYMLPFRNNIRDISYDGRNIILTISYE